MTQEQLAAKLSVVKQTVCNWEKGYIMPSVEVLENIADLFHVSTDYLLGREDGNPVSGVYLDVTGLTPSQIDHLRLIVEDIRNSQ